jgi:shikimate dehydrogenase
MFDGAGFVRGVQRKGLRLDGARALVVGSGGVGSAISASLVVAGVSAIGLHDANPAAAEALGGRLSQHYPGLAVTTGSNDPAGYDIVVNATPLGMAEGDPPPMNVDRIDPATFVGEVVMKQEVTPFLHAAQAKGCRTQVGTAPARESRIGRLIEHFAARASVAGDDLRHSVAAFGAGGELGVMMCRA